MTTEAKLEKLGRVAAAKGHCMWLTFQNGKWELIVDIDAGKRLRCADPTLAAAVYDVFVRVFTPTGRRRKATR